MKQPKINGIKQEFDILAFDNRFEHIKVNNEKGKDEDLYILDRVCNNWDLSRMKRGMRLVAMHLKEKIKVTEKKL